jgi:DNA-binding response OmpR family regulator
MDLHMPKLDGWAAIRELQRRAMTAAIPVIVLTGHDVKAYLKPAALAVGAVSYVMKPCLPEHLAREISARLTARRSRGHLPADLRSVGSGSGPRPTQVATKPAGLRLGHNRRMVTQSSQQVRGSSRRRCAQSRGRPDGVRPRLAPSGGATVTWGPDRIDRRNLLARAALGFLAA